MKRILSLLLALLITVPAVPFTAGAADPVESYVRETAPNEDADISMWFSHSNVKVHQEDTSSTGRDTYSVYMAKNEYQGTQVTLYSPTVTKTNISANISPFEAMDGSGATMSADVYYEFYVGCHDLDATDVLGVERAEDSFIREGMIPDAMAKVSDINRQSAPGKFTLTAGLTQTLYIKIKSESDTPAGWYSARFNVTDADGGVIKTATVYAHVWNFEIPDAVHLKTAFYIDMEHGLSEAVYKNYYDYLLDNRLCGMNLPGELNSSNEYLTNPRVTAFRVSDKRSYLGLYSSSEIKAVYDDLSSSPDFDAFRDKVYFYTTDEPRSPGSPTVHNVRGRYEIVERGWPDPDVLVTVDENHPYPNGFDVMTAYDSKSGTYLTESDGSERFANVYDAVQGMMDEGSVTAWCMKTDAFTPPSVTAALGYDGTYRTYKVKSLNGTISGFNVDDEAGRYFNWDSVYGPFTERFAAYAADRHAAGKRASLWTYECGKGPDYTYCNHLIENTGLQTELLFWQSMQLGAVGYLYYGVNFWDENVNTTLTDGSGVAYDGSTVSDLWKVNRHTQYGSPEGTYAYGNGVLLYGLDVKNKLRIASPREALGTVRVEMLRDGVEDYEMLYMYREAYGEAAMQNMIKKVSNNVVDYLSMPSFDISSYGGASAEDVFASVRIELGSALEAPEEEDKLIGDVNLDGKINLNDLADIKKLLAGAESAAAFSEVNSDINEDGKLNLDDLKAIKILLA